MPHPEGPFCRPSFDHRQHVKFAWSAVRQHGAEQAERIVSNEIRDFAAVHAPGKYHQTMTSFWVRLVAHTISVVDSDDFGEHVRRFPILLEKEMARRHYSDALLMSENFCAPRSCIRSAT